MNAVKPWLVPLALLASGCVAAGSNLDRNGAPKPEARKICGIDAYDADSLAAALRSMPSVRNITPPGSQYEMFQAAPNRAPAWIVSKPEAPEHPAIVCMKEGLDSKGKPDLLTSCESSEQSCKALLARFSIKTEIIRTPTTPPTAPDDQHP